MDSFLNKLKEKYNYSDELIDFLRKAIPNIIDYYGPESADRVVSSLLDCEIHFALPGEDRKEFLNNYFDTNQEWEVPNSLTTSFQHTELKINNNKITSKKIIYIKNDNFDFNNEKNLDTLLHEILHCIKNSDIEIIGDKVVQNCGLMKTVYAIKNNNFVEVEVKNLGIEEGANCVDTAQILSKIINKNLTPKGYGWPAFFVLELCKKSDEIKKMIRHDQIFGGNDWYDMLGENAEEYIEKMNDAAEFYYTKLTSGNANDPVLDAAVKKLEEAKKFLSEFEPNNKNNVL